MLLVVDADRDSKVEEEAMLKHWSFEPTWKLHQKQPLLHPLMKVCCLRYGCFQIIIRIVPLRCYLQVNQFLLRWAD